MTLSVAENYSTCMISTVRFLSLTSSTEKPLNLNGNGILLMCYGVLDGRKVGDLTSRSLMRDLPERTLRSADKSTELTDRLWIIRLG